jgi:hypothetical protein
MPTRIFVSSTSFFFAIFPAETRSCSKLTSALYHFMIVVEEWFCWKIFQCKRVMREKDFSLSCVVVIRLIGFKKAACSRQLRFAIFHDKTTSIFKT